MVTADINLEPQKLAKLLSSHLRLNTSRARCIEVLSNTVRYISPRSAFESICIAGLKPLSCHLSDPTLRCGSQSNPCIHPHGSSLSLKRHVKKISLFL
jgi:hypothetical protein